MSIKDFVKENLQKNSKEEENRLRDNLITTGVIILIFTFIIGWLFGIVGFFGGLILGSILLLAGLLQPKSQEIQRYRETFKPEDEPIKVLKLRYAKGEITKEEFEEMKKDLESD